MESYLLILVGAVIAIAWKKIDVVGGITGVLITSLLYTSVGYLGIAVIGLFFGIGSVASSFKVKRKQALKLQEKKEGRRGWKNVLSNSGAAGLVALINLLTPELIYHAQLPIAVCLAAALSDTLSSEMGNVTGSRYFNIVTLEPGRRGVDGVISLEGLGWGMLGSSIIGLVYTWYENTASDFLLVASLGLTGNLVDSFLGATWQRADLIGNHGVNFLSTTIATLLAVIITFW